MPRPNGSYLATIAGRVASGAGRWSTSFALSATDESAFAVASQINASFQGNPNVYEAIQNMISTNDSIDELLVYKYGPQGSAVDNARISINRTGAVAESNPKSTCWVMTLRTNLASRSGRGRMYFPLTGGNITLGGLVETAHPTSIMDGFAQLTSSQGPDGAQPAVYSPTDGVSRIVTAYDGDRVPDRQEHRERGLSRARFSNT